MRKIYITVIILCMNIHFIISQNVSLTLESSLDTIYIGNRAQINVTLTNSKAQFKIPTIPPDLNVINQSESSSFIVMNGETKSSRTINILIKPIKPGIYHIPKAKATHKGDTFYSDSLKIVVLDNPDRIIQEQALDIYGNPMKRDHSKEKTKPKKSEQLPSKRKIIKI